MGAELTQYRGFDIVVIVRIAILWHPQFLYFTKRSVWFHIVKVDHQLKIT